MELITNIINSIVVATMVVGMMLLSILPLAVAIAIGLLIFRWVA